MVAIDSLDALASFTKFADDMRDIYERYQRPAYAETCTCGASVEASRETDPKERRQIRIQFQGRHRSCIQQVDFGGPGVTVLGQVGETDR